jgi:hypothetical protein
MPLADPVAVARLRAMIADPDEADALLERWLRRFRAVADRGLRRTVLQECLEDLDDASLLGVLHRLSARAESGEATCRWLATELALAPSLLLALPYERTADLYTIAREAEQPRLAALFLGDRTGAQVPDTAKVNPHLDATPGERTAAARRQDRFVLDRLLHDRDPRVVAVLLENPRITERDVVRIAAMRPTVAEALELVAAHAKWGQRYRVRQALVFNPACPFPLARRILPTLLRQHLAELAASNALSPELRDETHVLLAKRSRR